MGVNAALGLKKVVVVKGRLDEVQLSAHNRMLAYPRSIEAPLIYMVKAWEQYAVDFKSQTDMAIGEDVILGTSWADMGENIRELLNGPTGRMDCGSTSTYISYVMESHGWEPRK